MGCPNLYEGDPSAHRAFEADRQDFLAGKQCKECGYEPTNLKDRSFSWLLGYKLTPAC